MQNLTFRGSTLLIRLVALFVVAACAENSLRGIFVTLNFSGIVTEADQAASSLGFGVGRIFSGVLAYDPVGWDAGVPVGDPGTPRLGIHNSYYYTSGNWNWQPLAFHDSPAGAGSDGLSFCGEGESFNFLSITLVDSKGTALSGPSAPTNMNINDWTGGQIVANSAPNAPNNFGSWRGAIQTPEAQDPFTNSLVAYYPFSGNANDESGNGNNGTFNAATLAVDRFGITNSAYAFDGVSSLITVPDSPSLRIPGDITVTCWLNFSASVNRVRFVGKGGDCGRNYGLWFDNGAYWMFQQFPPEGGCTGCQENTDSASPGVVMGKWYQMVGVRSGSVARIYVNGIQMKEESVCAGITYTGSEPLIIGAFDDPITDPRFNVMQGSLDDIRIYSRALSSNEVAQLYAIESPPILTLRKAVYVDSTNVRVGTNYQLQVSTDLDTWTNHGAVFTATNSTWRATDYWDMDNWDSLFFRLQVSR